MKIINYLLFLSLSVCVFADQFVHFHGEQVLRCEVVSQEQIEIVKSLELDVWSRDSNLVLGVNDIRVNVTQKKELARNNFNCGVMIEDLEKLISDEREYHQNAPKQIRAFYDQYNTFDQIVAYVQGLAAAYPSLATFVPFVGQSLQGRNIPAIHLTAGTQPGKKKIFFNGGQHAREWIGPATVIYITEQLLSTYATDPVLLDNIEFVIVPLINADGYTFTWTNNRLWRKNRRPNTGGSFGVDLNRNWDDHWGGEGSSSNPTSETYHGTAPFSEPESKAVADYITRTGPFLGAIDYHSYSQLVLRPYGWTTTPPPNEALAKVVGDGIAARILATSGVVYTSEPSWQLYYTAGTAQDWYYAPAKIPLSYTIELRDTGNYGFELPPAQIIPTGNENWVAFKYFATFILTNVSYV